MKKFIMFLLLSLPLFLFSLELPEQIPFDTSADVKNSSDWQEIEFKIDDVKDSWLYCPYLHNRLWLFFEDECNIKSIYCNDNTYYMIKYNKNKTYNNRMDLSCIKENKLYTYRICYFWKNIKTDKILIFTECIDGESDYKYLVMRFMNKVDLKYEGTMLNILH